MQEDDFVVPLADRHVEVAHRGQPRRQLCELVEVRGEEDLGAHGAIVQVFHDRPGDGQPVERRGPAPDFVQQHEAPRRDVVEDRRRLDHLHEKRRLAARQVVLRADAREHAVDHADARRARGHPGAHLRQEHDVTGLAQIDGLPRHVRPGEDDDARVGVERDIVGRDRLARARLEHRMAALDDLERVSGIDHGSHVPAHVRDLPQPRDDVQ